MGKWVRRILIIVFLAVFLFCAGSLYLIMSRYKNDDMIYFNAAKEYTIQEEDSSDEAVSDEDEGEIEFSPIGIDFESLLAANSDIIGWIYCEDTVINYPVLQGEDNDFYLHHTYEGDYSVAGSIFVDTTNRPGFVDSNTVIYGHHMKNGSMFASLEKWKDQEYYEEHPVMWLLTPEQDYKIVLFSCYGTSAYSDTYTVFTRPCEELNDYLDDCVWQSEFQSDIELDPEAHYVVLSTCAYMFDNARYVVHGMLIPVGKYQADQSGGIYKWRN